MATEPPDNPLEGADLATAEEAKRPGNGNAGHTYGTTLSADDKRALLEYLKTL